MLQATRRMCLLVAIAVAALQFSATEVQAQAPPFPEIAITEPEDDATFENGHVLHAKGTSSEPNTGFTLVITNIFNTGSGMITNTHTIQGQTDDGGAWEDSMNISVYGPGSWEVKVYFTASPQIKDIRSGTVEGTP